MIGSCRLKGIAITESHPHAVDANDTVLADLLVRTSRTFALAIPCLPLPARKVVTVAYLLFRIADTIEDAIHLDRAEKLAALDSLARLLRRDWDLAPRGVRLDLPRLPTDNVHDLALLDQISLVIDNLARLDPDVRAAVVTRALTSIAGMTEFITAGTPDGKVRIQSISELRDYCYYVAGVVGEMLTDIFLLVEDGLSDLRDELDSHARWFGEGLQLVNILKDSADDQRDGRIFIPTEATRIQLFDLARKDLHKAESYVRALRRAEASDGLVAFTNLPLKLAWRTLDCVETFGPGSKVSRNEVMSILAETLSEDVLREVASSLGEVASK